MLHLQAVVQQLLIHFYYEVQLIIKDGILSTGRHFFLEQLLFMNKQLENAGCMLT